MRSLCHFFFSSSGVHGDLHSFPTRRSSDLVRVLAAVELNANEKLHCRADSAETGKDQAITTPGRSEEHTSELQSLRHLVCRLLLEKKKPTHAYYRALGNTRTVQPQILHTVH